MTTMTIAYALMTIILLTIPAYFILREMFAKKEQSKPLDEITDRILAGEETEQPKPEPIPAPEPVKKVVATKKKTATKKAPVKKTPPKKTPTKK